MDSIRKRNGFIKNVEITYDNTQRLIKNGIGSFKRFNQQDNSQKLRNLFVHGLKKYLWTGFFIFGTLLVINVVIMTFYKTDFGYSYNLMDNSYVDAVLPSQDIGGIMDLGIVAIEKPIYETLGVGDKVIVYGDFSLDVYWVETIVSLNDETQTINLTYDNVTINSYHIDEVLGQYTSDADFLGTIYYTSMFTRGYIFLAISHVLLLYGYWYIFLNNKYKEYVSKVSTNYREQLGLVSGLDQEVVNNDIDSILNGINTETLPGVVSTQGKVIDSVEVVEAVTTLKPKQVIKSKGDIIEQITFDTGLSPYKGKTFLKYFAKVITEELSKGEDIHIINFGKFTTVKMPAKDAINPKSNEKMVVPEHRQARFRFYKEVKSKIE